MTTIEIVRVICREILHSSLGESAGEAILFFLRSNLGRDPFEVLWDDPGAFYREMEKIFGVGAKVLVKLLVSRINSELGLNISPERFLELMQRGDQRSAEEIHSFLTKIADSYRVKVGMHN